MNKPYQLGIVARYYPDDPPFGRQNYFFKDIYESAKDLEVELLCFDPQSFADGQCRGYILQDRGWVVSHSPLPRYLYERIWPLDAKEGAAFAALRRYAAEQGHRYLNPPDLLDVLKDKLQAAALFERLALPQLQSWKLKDLDWSGFAELLDGGKSLYVKPLRGSHGQGIGRIFEEAGRWCWQNAEGRSSFAHLEELWQALLIQGMQGSFFVQEEGWIPRWEGRPHDLRVLLQNDGRGGYGVSGAALRLGAPESLVSNFNAGGIALAPEEAEDFFAQHYDRPILEEALALCLKAGRALHAEFGPYFELGVDVLLSPERGPLILEINGKPARWTFQVIADTAKSPKIREEYQQIRQMSCRRVAGYLRSLS